MGGVVAGTLELLQIGDAALYARMGAEEVAYEGYKLAIEELRADNVELCHILAVNIPQGGVPAYLAKG